MLVLHSRVFEFINKKTLSVHVMHGKTKATRWRKGLKGHIKAKTNLVRRCFKSQGVTGILKPEIIEVMSLEVRKAPLSVQYRMKGRSYEKNTSNPWTIYRKSYTPSFKSSLYLSSIDEIANLHVPDDISP